MSRSNSRTGTENKKLSQLATGMLVALLAVALFLSAAPVPVVADEGGFTTDSFNVRVQADQNHVFHVTEEINVDFSAPRHGLYRYIPEGGRYYDVIGINVEGHNYEVYSEGNNQVVQIGDADYYVNGPQTYRISYDIVGYKDDDETRDMLSIDLLPTGWSTPIQSADLTLELPGPAKDIKFYSGGYGNSSELSAGQYFDIEESGSTIHAQSRQVLPQGVGLTVSADLPEGYWVNPASRENSLPSMYGAIGVMGMLMMLMWLFIGRDDPIIRTVEFYPPDNMDPLEVAYIGNDTVSVKDIAAQFMYFAGRGYTKITSEDGRHFSMSRIRDIDLAERNHSRQIFNGLFSERDTVRLNDLPSSFGEVAAGIKKDVVDSLGGKKQIFSTASKTGRILGLLFCFMIPVSAGMCDAFLTFTPFASIVGLVCGAFILFCMIGLVARTDAFRTKKKPAGIVFGLVLIFAAILAEALVISIDYMLLAVVFAASALAAVIATIFVRRRMNNEIYGRVLGFREFISTAEYDRLKMLSDEDPEYYYNILPYAQIFGMTTKWTEKFSNISIQQPTWYDGAYPYDPFFGRHIFIYTGNGLANSVNSYHQSIGKDIFSGVDSGTGGMGGFGGGGFSGGGFGGGGGGSW